MKTNKAVIAAAGAALFMATLLFADEVVVKVSDDMIRNLLRRGEVCRVIGKHIWERTPHVTLEYRPDGDYPEHRKCVLCGRVETKESSAWKGNN